MTLRSLSRIALWCAVVALALPGAVGAHPAGQSAAQSASQSAAKDYVPPFKLGPAGGDAWNYRSAETGGRVTVARAYPVPAIIGCGAGAAHAKLLAEHAYTAPLEKVSVAFTEAVVSPYVFISVRVHTPAGEWLGGRKIRGSTATSGTVDVPVEWPLDEEGEPRRVDAVVEFGLEISSACPSADGGSIRFTRVTVS